jgi:hypothetical protein
VIARIPHNVCIAGVQRLAGIFEAVLVQLHGGAAVFTIGKGDGRC